MSEAAAGDRDSRKDWQPAERPATAPLWAWPPRPFQTLKWIAAYPGYLFPWNAIFFAIALVTWAYLTPEMGRMVEFRIDWIAEIYFRNLGLLVLWAGGWHLRLYTFRGQGAAYKYNPIWLHDKSPTFLWGSQLGDNMFWNLASACTVWTAHEVGFMWGYANGLIPAIDWRTEPVTFTLLVLAVMVWREIHFYGTHRLLHWKPLYRTVHYLHHRYFECNYGSPLVPLDRWFGSFHDGSPESHARMQERWRARRA